MATRRPRKMNVHQAVMYLENLSDDDEITSAQVYIDPPINANNENSDEDSGDENLALDDPNKLSRHQLLAGASMKVNTRTSLNVDKTESDDEDNDSENIPTCSYKRIRLSTKNVDKSVFKWHKGDLKKKQDVKWNQPQPTLLSFDSPTTLFEKLMTAELVTHICEQTLHYATSKSVTLQIDEVTLKRFIAILLISGYVPVPRRPMYWEIKEDSYNEAISSIMSRNEFDRLMSNLHVADNSDLDRTDRFAKVKPRFSALSYT